MDRCLAVTEHVVNCCLMRDKFSHKILDCLLAEFLERYGLLLDKINSGESEPLYDDILAMADYLKAAMTQILQKPRANIVTVTAREHHHKLKEISPKTLQWISKQSGVNMRQKLAAKERVLTQKKIYTTDILENQAAVQIYKEFKEALSSRPCDYFSDLTRKLKKSELADVPARKISQPNNVLLNDRHYSIVWRAGTLLRHRQAKEAERNASRLQRFIKLICWGIAARIYQFDQVYALDFMSNFHEYRFALQNRETGNDDVVITLLRDTNRHKYLITLKTVSDDLHIEMKIMKSRDAKFETIKTLSYSYRFSCEDGDTLYFYYKYYWDEDSRTRTIPRKIEANEIELKKFIDDFVDERIIKYWPSHNIKNSHLPKIDTAAFDFSGYLPRLLDEHTGAFMLERYVVTASNSDYLSREYSIYDMMQTSIGLRDAMRYKKVANYASKIVSSLCRQEQGLFIYVMADSARETSASVKNLKRAFKEHYRQSYPVWRSVAAATAALQQWSTRKPLSILVIDCYDEHLSAVRLDVNRKDGLLERYPYKELPHNGLDIVSLMKNYLERFALKYELNLSDGQKDFLIHSGQMEKILVYKNETLMFIDGALCVVFYDAALIAEIATDYAKVINKLMKELPDVFDGWQPQCVVFVNDFICVDALEARNNTFDTVFVTNAELLRGAISFAPMIDRQEKLWYDHLPNLSLRLPVNGRYTLLKLTQNKCVENTFGAAIAPFAIPDILTLPKGASNYKFPLIKDINGQNQKEASVYIQHSCFPMPESLDVELSLSYSYGDENSYRLYLKPIGDTKPFDSISFDLNDDPDDLPMVVDKPIKLKPKGLVEDAERQLKDFFEMNFEGKYQLLVQIKSGCRQYKYEVSDLTKKLKKARLHIFNVLVNNGADRTHQVGFFKVHAPQTMRPLLRIYKWAKIEMQGFEEKSDLDNTKIIEQLRQLAMAILNFIVYFLDAENIAKLCANTEIDDNMFLANMLCFQTHQDIIFDKAVERLESGKFDSFLNQLRRSIPYDDQILIKINQRTPRLLKKILDLIEKKFSFAVKRFNNANSPLKLTSKTDEHMIKRLKSYGEIMLYILKLRDELALTEWAAGSVCCKKMAEQVIFFDNMGFLDVSYSLEKKDKGALFAMDDLAFLLNAFLTGEEVNCLPSVVTFKEEDSEIG